MSTNFSVLVIEDDLFEQKIMTAILEQEKITLEFVATGQDGVEKAIELGPDLIILDILLPDINGFEVCRQVRKIPHLAEVPILMVTVLDDNASRLKGIEAGADDFVSKPYSPVELRARVRTIARLDRFRRLREERIRFKNLVELSPDGVTIIDQKGLPTFANPTSADHFRIRIGEDFPAFEKDGSPASLSAMVHNMTWTQVIPRARNPGVEIVFHPEAEMSMFVEMHIQPIRWDEEDSYLVTLHDITARKQAAEEIRKLNQSLEQRVVERTIELQVVNRSLMDEIAERNAVESQLRYFSTHDSLTGLTNRAFFETEFTRLSKSSQYPISILMIDMDGLKAVNDSRGHQAGDQLLCRAATVLKRSLRAQDIIARFGGDEIVVLLPQTNAEALQTVLVRIQAELARENCEPIGVPVSFSLGSATAGENDSLEENLKLADRRMYASKKGKR